MNYQETLDYLYAQLPMYSRIGQAAYKADLTNTIALCEALGNPQHTFKSIHIAGTNGKGSTSHMLAAMLQQQGYKTGLYTSPHITDFGERIRINGEMIDESFVIEFTEKTRQLCAHIKPSFFELTVAMAFTWFAKQRVDIAVIETGLGGRLDSTNVIQPILSIITNIGYDHMNMLGDTIEQIAFEKAGIIKKNTPVVIGQYTHATITVFKEKSAKEQAPLYLAQDLYDVTDISSSSNSLQCIIRDRETNHSEMFSLDLTGRYQLQNVRTVLTAEKVLHQSGFFIENKNEKIALSSVKKLTGLKGRWDILSTAPTIICDVGHNKDGIQSILNQLDENYPESKLHFILGFVNDKDVDDVLRLFPKDALYYFTNAHIPRALPFQILQEQAMNTGLNGKGFDDVNMALNDAKSKAALNDVIIVCGSFFVIAELNHYRS